MNRRTKALASADAFIEKSWPADSNPAAFRVAQPFYQLAFSRRPSKYLYGPPAIQADKNAQSLFLWARFYCFSYLTCLKIFPI